jgi:hypothetical protein
METDKQKPELRKPVFDPGYCPACGQRFLVQQKGYYCSGCGYMGWFTYDQYFDD